jgi:hypothetical protein
MTKVAILQSNYIPWKGYFDIIAAVDHFILYDDMQFTKNDWRNRNKIKTPRGLEWLSIPVGQNINRRIRDVSIPNSLWQKKHWKTLEANYGRAPYFDDICELLEPVYLRQHNPSLSGINRELIEIVCDYLQIRTRISNSWDFKLGDGKTERLVDLCVQAGASEYISGPAARDYIDARVFSDKGIKLTWFEYTGYPQYPQLWGDFAHGVTVLDLLFNCGPESERYMKNVRP